MDEPTWFVIKGHSSSSPKPLSFSFNSGRRDDDLARSSSATVSGASVTGDEVDIEPVWKKVCERSSVVVVVVVIADIEAIRGGDGGGL